MGAMEVGEYPTILLCFGTAVLSLLQVGMLLPRAGAGYGFDPWQLARRQIASIRNNLPQAFDLCRIPGFFRIGAGVFAVAVRARPCQAVAVFFVAKKVVVLQSKHVSPVRRICCFAGAGLVRICRLYRQ
jgi:hypothetical protein